MSRFSIFPQQIRTLSDDEGRIADQLEQYANELDSVRADIRAKVKSRYGIDQALISIGDQIRQYHNNVSACRSALDAAVLNYEKTEGLILENCVPPSSIADGVQGGVPAGPGETIPVIDSLTLRNIVNALSNFDLDDIIEALKNFKNMNPGEALSKWLLERGIDVSGIPVLAGLISGLNSWDAVKDFISDVPGAIRNGISDYIVDKTSFGAGVGGDGELYSIGVSGKYGSMSLDLGAYDYYADAEGHIFRKDENGNLVFDPRVSAAMGASFTALSFSGNAAIGNDFLGAGAKGEIAVGRAAGNASAEAALYDEYGNFNPNASLNASLEAVAAEAKGEVGMNIAGVDAKAFGSAYVGVGGHADFEFSGGKIKAELGAALGVGISVGFEIDVGGAIKAVQDACHSFFSNLFHW